MHPAAAFASAPASPLFRRLVLGTALFLALAIGLSPRPPGVHAQEAKPASPPAAAAPATPKAPAGPSLNATVKDGEGAKATIDITVDKGRKTITIDKTDPAKAGADAADDTSDEPIIGIGSGKHGKRVRVGVFGDDREYDSFNDFVHTEPGLAFMVVSIVALVFLSPVLAIALILWYRMRKARMLNETMLKLAEKGVVPPAEALGALSGNTAAALAAGPSTAPIYEQAKQIRRRAAWTDLRKGVILGGIGLGLTMYSMFDDRSPNGLGLVLLFVGIGYIVLWWFEERQFTARGNGASGAPPASTSGGSDGTS
jgi:hypothetical protein